MSLRTWRAPRWMPLFVRRLFPGVWTQAEVDAHREWARHTYQRLFDD